MRPMSFAQPHRVSRTHTIFMQVQEALLLEEGLHVNAPALVLYEPLLCDDALDEGGRSHIKGWIPHLHAHWTEF